MKEFEHFAYFTRHSVVDVTTTCNFHTGVQLFVDYGKHYGRGFDNKNTVSKP